MKLALLVYLASISGQITVFFSIFGGVLIAVYAWGILYKMVTNGVYDGESPSDLEKRNSSNKIQSKTNKLSIIGIVFIIFAILLPSEKTIYIMAGAYATEQIATNDRVQKIGSDVLEVIEGKLSKMKKDQN